MGAMVSGASLMENTARMACALAPDMAAITPPLAESTPSAPGRLFNAAGQPMQHMQRGLNIKRLPDGRTVKVIKH